MKIKLVSFQVKNHTDHARKKFVAVVYARAKYVNRNKYSPK